jgi:hypothetical protein
VISADDPELARFAQDMLKAGHRVLHGSYSDRVGDQLLGIYYGPGVVVDANKLATIEAETPIDVVGLPLSDGRIFVCPRSVWAAHAPVAPPGAP